MLPDSKIAGTITGISGATYEVGLLSFDPTTYHFTYGPYEQDVSNDLYSKDKQQLIPDFDLQLENNRRASENGSYKPGGIQPLSESTADIFVNQIATDPLAAPLDALNKGFDQLVASPGIRKLVLLGFGGLLLFVILNQAER